MYNIAGIAVIGSRENRVANQKMENFNIFWKYKCIQNFLAEVMVFINEWVSRAKQDESQILKHKKNIFMKYFFFV